MRSVTAERRLCVATPGWRHPSDQPPATILSAPRPCHADSLLANVGMPGTAHRGVWIAAAPGRIGMMRMAPIYQSLGTKEEKRA